VSNKISLGASRNKPKKILQILRFFIFALIPAVTVVPGRLVRKFGGFTKGKTKS